MLPFIDALHKLNELVKRSPAIWVEIGGLGFVYLLNLVKHKVFSILVEMLRVQVHAIINICDPDNVSERMNVFFEIVRQLFVDEVVLGVKDELVEVWEGDVAKLL